MPAPILHFGATVLCTHAGTAAALTPFPRVTVSGQPVATLSCLYSIAGCALTGTTVPPCVLGQFTTGATRVYAGGFPVATLTGNSTCIPTGTPMLPLMAQTRALAG